MSTPSPAAARKRQNTTQPSITSFFNQDRVPALPPSVKSNLLNVGMRVRKSVPEGYKSGSYMFNKFPVSKATPATAAGKSNTLSTPSKKREYDENTAPEETPLQVAEVRADRQIAVPKSQRRKHYAAIPRGNGDVMMIDEDDFEEAAFLTAASDEEARE